MKNIKQDIKSNNYKQIYLIYGEDDYMKKLYKEKLKNGLLGDSDEMNYSYFTGDKIDIDEIVKIAQTVPFFNDRRVIVIENSKLFTEANDLSDYIEELPESTHIVFSESNVDKRNKLFKKLKKIAYIVEMNGLTENDLLMFIKSELAKSSMAISEQDVRYMLDKIGKDMNNIKNECIKVCSYAYGRNVITREDIDAVCITLLENKIFEMLDKVAMGDSIKALALYNDLIALKESPVKILTLITRHYNILYKMAEGRKSGVNDKDMASILKIPPFAVRKYAYQLSNYTEEMLYSCLNDCVEIDEMFKTGKIDVQIGVEMLIVKFSINRVKKQKKS